MKEISNQTLAFLLVLAVVLSLGGTFLSLKKLDQLTSGAQLVGFVAYNTTTGSVNVSISDITQINFSAQNLSFGSGVVQPGLDTCNLSSIGTEKKGCVGFNTPNAPLTVRNIGNNNVILNLSFSANASTFIGGSDPTNSFRFKMTNNTNPGCDLNMRYLTWEEANITDQMNTTVCTNLTFWANKDAVNIDINMSIPSNAPKGVKSMSITATGQSV